jgi:hypothetical protein
MYNVSYCIINAKDAQPFPISVEQNVLKLLKHLIDFGLIPFAVL